MKAALVIALLCCAAPLAGCGDAGAPADQPAQYQRAPADQVDGGIPGSGDMCEEIAAQRKVNERLHADGYADDYSEEWDAMANAQGCPTD